MPKTMCMSHVAQLKVLGQLSRNEMKYLQNTQWNDLENNL